MHEVCIFMHKVRNSSTIDTIKQLSNNLYPNLLPFAARIPKSYDKIYYYVK